MNSYNRYISSSAIPKYEEEYSVKTEKKAKPRNNTKLFYKLYTTGLFAVIFTVVFRYTVITELNTQVRNLNKQLTRVEKELQQSYVSLETMTDLNTVEKVAMEELNMAAPQQHQIVEIDVNMGSKAVVKSKNTQGGRAWFSDLVCKCMEYLY